MTSKKLYKVCPASSRIMIVENNNQPKTKKNFKYIQIIFFFDCFLLTLKNFIFDYFDVVKLDTMILVKVDNLMK